MFVKNSTIMNSFSNFISFEIVDEEVDAKIYKLIEKTKGSGIDLANNDEVLAELNKIRELLEKAPPPPPPKGLWNEFKEFLKGYKILGLAVAFVLGLYLGALVKALVQDFIMPLIGLAIPGSSNLPTYVVTVMKQQFGIGDFLLALITFLIVALVVFLIVKIAKRWKID